jgi:hypothetical protein
MDAWLRLNCRNFEQVSGIGRPGGLGGTVQSPGDDCARLVKLLPCATPHQSRIGYKRVS